MTHPLHNQQPATPSLRQGVHQAGGLVYILDLEFFFVIWAFCNILLVCWALKTNNHSSQRITWISESDVKQQGTNSKLQICTFDKPCQSQICTVRKKSLYNYICSLSQRVFLSIGKNLHCLTDYVKSSVYSFRKSFPFHKVV